MLVNNLKWNARVLHFFAIIILNCQVTISQGQHLPKALLLTGNGNLPQFKENYPPWIHEFHNDLVIQILDGIVQIDTTIDMTTLNRENLINYDLIISNSLFLTPEEEQLRALYEFVAEGKSFLSLHCGILSFMNWKKYEEFMGGIFIGGPSSDPENFKVYTANNEFWGYPYNFRKSSEHSVSAVVDDFDTKDELYYFQPNKIDFFVIARAENHPIMWWHPVGKGKVMSLTLGHDVEAKNTQGYQELLKNGVRWLMNYSLIRTPKQINISNRKLDYHNFFDLNVISENEHKDSLTYSIFSQNPLFSVNYVNDARYDLKLLESSGTATFDVTVENSHQLRTTNQVLVNVINDGEGNLALYHENFLLGSPSENQSKLFHINNIIDGDLASRWSSKPDEKANVTIDLQKSYEIGKINIYWEASYAVQYDVLFSRDGQNWSYPDVIKNREGQIDSLQFPMVKAQYIKLDLNQRAPGKQGYSIYEIEIYK